MADAANVDGFDLARAVVEHEDRGALILRLVDGRLVRLVAEGSDGWGGSLRVIEPGDGRVGPQARAAVQAAASESEFSFPMNLTIPCDRCTTCGREIREGEEAQVVLRAGSAWKDGYAELAEGAELYTATVLCADCQEAESNG